MSENIAISDLKAIAKKNGYDHVICFATKGRKQFVATYGITIEACDQAAQFGDKLKDKLGWPESLHAMPSRVRQLKSRAEVAERDLAALKEQTRWIPVGERLPEVESYDTGLEYIVWLDGVRQAAMYFEGGGWYSRSHTDWTNRVTHWMPLPVTPPEGA